MQDFLSNNKFVLFDGWVFQQTIGIPMGTKCTQLLADLFLRAYEANVLQGLLKNKDRILVQTFNSSFRYIEDVLSLNNSRFGDYIHHIYPSELILKSLLPTLIFTLKSTMEEDQKQNSTTNAMSSLFQ